MEERLVPILESGAKICRWKKGEVENMTPWMRGTLSYEQDLPNDLLVGFHDRETHEGDEAAK